MTGEISVAGIAALVALTAGAWYARRRWGRQVWPSLASQTGVTPKGAITPTYAYGGLARTPLMAW